MPEISPALYRAGEGEPLVLLHGFSGTWHHWRPVLADLVARFEVIAPTLAGHHGGPSYEEREVSFRAAADSLERHLDGIGVGSAHFAGNSMGGALSIEMAKRGRALSVVGIAPAGGWSPGSPEGARLARLFTRQFRLARAAEARLPAIMRRPRARRLVLRDAMWRGEHLPPAEAVDLVRASLRCAIFDKAVAALRAGVTIDDLDQVRAPTLVAWPQYDRIIPMERCSQRFRSEIPGVEFRVLQGVGHVPMWDDPRLVAETTAGFAGRHAAVPAAAA